MGLALAFLVWPHPTPLQRTVATGPGADPAGAAAGNRATADAAGGVVSAFAVALSADARDSVHPVERAAAAGTTFATHWEEINGGHWRRTRLMQTPVQPRLVRVVDDWSLPGAAGPAVCVRREMFLADQLIVATTADAATLRSRLAGHGWQLADAIAPGLYTVRLASADLDAVPAALRTLADLRELVIFAEADGVGFGGAVPNDTHFATTQWNLRNTGQSGGLAGIDINAQAFWQVTGHTSGVLIAVLDSGLNFTHPDLLDLDCTHPGELAGDGVDNDGNGFIDDVRGWDWVNNDNDPTDDHGHGSNVTGIIAATRDNGTGIAGIVSGAQFVICKILNANNSGFTSHLIAATVYARHRGAQVMNLSLQNYPYSAALDAEFTACAAAGITLSICAGNQGNNNDVTPNYPSSYPHANILSVGNHDRTNQRWSGSFNPSNYGAASVDLFAPGREIAGPVLGTGYSLYTGTSQAAPHVTAICAALLHANPDWKAPEVKAAILGSVVTSAAYSGLCVSGGRLDALAAVGVAVRQRPDRDSDGDGFANLIEFLTATRLDLATSQPPLELESTGDALRLSVPRVLRTGARLEVETSSDLVLWTTAGVTDESTPEALIARIQLTGSPARGFLRLRATAD